MLPRRPRVLVLTLSFGSGHLRAAAAVAEALRADATNADVKVVDALEGCNPIFRALYVWPYWLMIRYAPALWDRLFSSRLRNRTDKTAPQWAFRLGCRPAFRAIGRFEPDVIVAAEVAACEIASIAQQRGLTAAPIVNLVTDHHAEPAWVKPGVHAYAVGSVAVRDQLCEWGAPRERITVTGIPTSARFQGIHDAGATRARYGIPPNRPIVLLMGGGMGPTRMDLVAGALCANGDDVQVVAITGHDTRVRARLEGIAARANGSLTVLGWVDDVAALMKAATVLVTKPGGVTTAEAAVCGVPMVLFDPIPGPEEHNAARVAHAGAGVLTRGTADTVAAVSSLLGDELRRAATAARARELASPSAAASAARIVWGARDSARRFRTLILTIRNGAGHTKAAEAIASAIELERGPGSAAVIDVADYMSFVTRLTHVDVYLWLVRHAPALWDRIDRYQKRQPHTSPEWYYRRGCRRLFEFVERADPSAIVATEVGCLEIAALIKRDLDLACPLVAVNGEYDADRSWVQPEVDLYTVPREEVRDELGRLGAPRQAIRAWGVPLAPEFAAPINRAVARASACLRLDLDPEKPIVVVAGGSEGLGRPDELAARVLAIEGLDVQVVLLAGRNAALKARSVALAQTHGDGRGRLKALGWTSFMRELMEAADVLVSKPGHTFDEAIATELPMVVLPPPPGSEQVQYRLLAEWGVGYPVRTIDEMTSTVTRLLTDAGERERCRRAAEARRNADAATRIAQWIDTHTAVAERDVRIGEERTA